MLFWAGAAGSAAGAGSSLGAWTGPEDSLEPEFEPQPARHNTNGIKAIEMFRMSLS